MKSKHPNIRKRLFIAFSLFIILQAAMSSIMYFQMKKLNAITNNIINHPYIVSNSVRDIVIHINDMYRTIKDVAVAKDTIQLFEAIAKIDHSEKLVYKKFEIVQKSLLGETEELNNAINYFINWKILRDKIILLVKKHKNDDEILKVLDKQNVHVDTLLSKTKILIDFANNKILEYKQVSLKIIRFSKIFITITIIMTFCFSIILAYWIFTSIDKPIKSIIKRTINLPDNYFQYKIPLNEKNPLKFLDTGVNQLHTVSENLVKEIKKREKIQSELEKELGLRKKTEIELKEHKNNLEELVKERTEDLETANEELKAQNEEQLTMVEELDEANKELERLNKLFVGREFRIKELRDEIAKLKNNER